jgi:penicillin-insensitive murein endopeptidase
MNMIKVLFCVLGLFSTSLGLAASPTDQEKILAPWLELQGGGEAVGPAQTVSRKNPDGTVTPWEGSLRNGSLLPESGDGFVRLNAADTTWGAGMMISLLTNSSAYYVQNFSPRKIYVASISQQNGGAYGPHHSHENGLDADVLFMGQTKYGTVLDSQGQITAKFDPQKNWNFWRLLISQKILAHGQPTTAVYMIFVAPVIKDFLCQWAAGQNLLADPVNAEVMRRLRRTAGHDTHFHVRLKCSPYYPECYQLNEIVEGPDCPTPK